MAETMTATTTTPLRLGQKVPDFELVTFEPSKGDFGKLSLRDQIANKRWTLLFFYPADFTFV
jgi:peroxiredoxin (alkyl hydroperoxide reductase subunit C)